MQVGSEEAVDAAIRAATWKPVLPLTPVKDAVSCIFDVVANGPDALGEGFCYLVAPISDAVVPSVEAGSRVPLREYSKPWAIHNHACLLCSS